MPKTVDSEFQVNTNLKKLAAAIGLKQTDLEIAKLSFIQAQTREQIARNKGLSVRNVKARLHTFAQFYKAADLPPADAVKALDGEMEENLSYVSPTDRYRNRLEAQTNIIKRLRESLNNRQIVIDNIVEALVGELGRYDPSPYKVPTFDGKKRSQPEYAMLELSDWQFGSNWKGEDVAGFSEVSIDILQSRVELLTKRVLHLVGLQRAAVDIPWLVINALGDFIENEIIWESQGTYIDLNASDQMIACMLSMEKMINTFLPHFEEIRFMAVSGNHGRMGKKPNSQHWKNNWDFLLYRFLAARFENEPRIKFFIGTSPWLAYTLPEAPRWNHVILHGDTIPNNLGIPYYGINRESYKMATLTNMPVHFVHMGHFHQPSVLDNTYGAKIINGCLTGASPFSVGKLMMGGLPQQLLMGIHPEHGRSWNYHVHLANMPEVSADEEGVFSSYVSG